MRIPRRNCYRHLALAMGVVAVLAGPAAAALAPKDLRLTAGQPPTGPRVAVPAMPVALVVQAPIKPTDYAEPTFDGPGFPAETTPEPASLITGLLGGGLALTAWVRRRRVSAKVEECEDMPEPA